LTGHYYLTIPRRGAVVEVKDVQILKGTRQIKDLAAHAQNRGVALEIFTNGRVPRRGRLADLIGSEDVIVVPLP